MTFFVYYVLASAVILVAIDLLGGAAAYTVEDAFCTLFFSWLVMPGLVIHYVYEYINKLFKYNK